MGGDWQNFRRMGGPPSPPQEKTLNCNVDLTLHLFKQLKKAYQGCSQTLNLVKALVTPLKHTEYCEWIYRVPELWS